jgi:hypothetical protein
MWLKITAEAMMRIYLAAAFFAAGFFALGAAGFLAAFGAFATFFGAAAFFGAGFAAFGLGAAAFFAAGLATAGFFADFTAGFFTFAPAAFGFLATDFFAAVAFFGFAATFFFSAAGFFGFTTFSFLAAAGNLNEPDAPLPLTWISCPLTTADFKNFLMNGANLSTSALYWAEMYFLMACSELPPRSFSVLTAATTISLTGGWLLGVFGFLGFSDFGLAAFFALAGDAAAGATTGAGSDIFFLALFHFHNVHETCV